MTFKPKQLDQEATKTFSETEVGALIESIDDKLDLILESQTGMRDDIRTPKSDYKHVGDRIDKTEVRLDIIEAR